LVTPEAIRATCLTGEPDEIIERIRELERAGIQEIALLSPADYQRKVYRKERQGGVVGFIVPPVRVSQWASAAGRYWETALLVLKCHTVFS
jgi:hypothetical protein